MEPNRLTRKIIEIGKPIKKGPRRKWLDQIQEIGLERGKIIAEMKNLARDRKAWKKWVQVTESPSDA